VKTPRKASSSFGKKLGGRAKVEARDYPSLDYVKTAICRRGFQQRLDQAFF